MRISRKCFGAAAGALALSAALTGTAMASAMLVDRGLPTANLNNAAGASRSNVAWVFPGKETTPADYWLVGDNFKNTGSNPWAIDSIRLWTVRATTTAVLLGGIDGSAMGVVSAAGTIAPATYADSTTYQGSGGSFGDMFQVDFAVNITLLPGQTYDFFLDGTGGTFAVPFVHASNAALSGSPQEQSNDSMLFANMLGGVLDATSIGSWTSLGNGWDKASDVNVQVFGVPEPASLALLGIALVGLAATRRRARS